MAQDEFQGQEPLLEPPGATAADHARHIAAGLEIGPQKYLHCSEVHNEKGCSLGLVGDEPEVVRAAVEHAMSRHHEMDTPSLRERIARGLRNITWLRHD